MRLPRIFRAWRAGGVMYLNCSQCESCEAITRLPHDAAEVHARFWHRRVAYRL